MEMGGARKGGKSVVTNPIKRHTTPGHVQLQSSRRSNFTLLSRSEVMR